MRGYSMLATQIDKKKDVFLNIDGFPVIINYSLHSLKRAKLRGVYLNSIVDMIKNGFDYILDLRAGERFILISEDYRISLIGCMHTAGSDIVIDIITTIDSDQPTNYKGTKVFYI